MTLTHVVVVSDAGECKLEKHNTKKSYHVHMIHDGIEMRSERYDIGDDFPVHPFSFPPPWNRYLVPRDMYFATDDVECISKASRIHDHVHKHKSERARQLHSVVTRTLHQEKVTDEGGDVDFPEDDFALDNVEEDDEDEDGVDEDDDDVVDEDDVEDNDMEDSDDEEVQVLDDEKAKS